MMTMVISGSDGVTFPDSTTQNTTDRYGFVNRIINGDMRIDQRNAGAAVTANSSYPVDRFRVDEDTDGAFSAQQDSSAPAGFVNSLKLTTTTDDASLSAGQFYRVLQRIEGTNVSDLGWGTANAKTVTLSFWVRSSLTGTFGGALINDAAARSYPFTYSISAADTWEQKSITIPGDTSGTWLTTTGIGIRVNWGLGVGSTYSGTANAWASAFYMSATGAVSVIGTLNATWYVTGVQLEVGSVATPFERRPFGTELALCQRYYFQDGPYNGSFGAGCHWSTTLALYHYRLPVPMRAAPTFSVSAASDFRSVANGTTFTGSSFGASFPTPVAARLDLTISGATAGHGSVLEHANANAKLMFNSEL
jgi:hypothetical protein